MVTGRGYLGVSLSALYVDSLPMGSSQEQLERLSHLVDIILFATLIIGSILFLRSILNQRVEILQEEEDRVFSEIVLPLSRLMNLLEGDDREDFEDDLVDALEEGYDQVTIVVRKHAWRNGIKVDPKETNVMYKHIREEDLTDAEQELFDRIEPEARNVMIFPGGLVICKPTRDNEV